MKCLRLTLGIVCVLMSCRAARGEHIEDEAFYPSGLMHQFVDDKPRLGAERAPERSALRAFLDRQFSRLGNDYEWREIQNLPDATHTHHLYALYFMGRRVDGAYLRAHFNRRGWVQYATSTFDEPLSARLPENTEADRQALEQKLKREIIGERGAVNGRIQIEPIFWLGPGGKTAIPAFDVHVDLYAPMAFRNFVVEQGTDRVLSRRSVVRNISNKVYLVSPYGPAKDDNGTFTSLTLPLLTNTSKLLNDFMYVRREQDYTSPGDNCGPSCLEDVSPITDFTLAGDFHQGISAPNNYSKICNGDSTQCGDQGFDGINVYYHLSKYRETLQPYFDALGVAPTAPRDPINVIIMAFNENVAGTSVPDKEQETNNAAFISRPCIVAQGDGTVNQVCLAFLRPAAVAQNIECGGPAQFYDVAREAVVMVHEYTHYITDSQTHMEGDFDAEGYQIVNVGDALHEGYSDYFAVSQVSYLNHLSLPTATNTDVTIVGEYAFQQCTVFERDIGQLKVYDPTSADSIDRYVVSQTWSSGLWNLRQQFGKDTVDKLVLKSQLFISPKPGFVEAVESLTRADEALYGGVHSKAIRKLFYETLHFYGSQGAEFRDAENGVVEVGFHSCNSVPMGRVPWAGGLLLLAWLEGLVCLGRRYRRRS